MKVAILETGAPPKDLRERYGRYDEMFAALLGDGFETKSFKVYKGKLPKNPAKYSGLLITGSPAGVYEDLPWIRELEAYLREASGKTKLVGVCFGHQVMASAFGGQVIKSPNGWGVGLQTYRMTAHPAWADDGETISIPVSHQDQVVKVPDSASVIGGNDFCPNGVLDYGFGISMQCHPEFSPSYASALLMRRHDLYDPEQLFEALDSLDRPNDNMRVAGWIRRYLAG